MGTYDHIPVEDLLDRGLDKTVDEIMGMHSLIPPCYSSDISLAFEAAEKTELFSNGFALTRHLGAYTDKTAWHVDRIDGRGVLQGYTADEDSAARAICEAIVKHWRGINLCNNPNCHKGEHGAPAMLIDKFHSPAGPLCSQECFDEIKRGRRHK